MGIGSGADASTNGELGHTDAVRSIVRERLAVLLVDRPAALEPLARTLAAQPIDVRTTDSAADALLLVGRAVPDVVVAGPVKDRGSNLVTLVGSLRRHEPELPVIVGLRPKDGRLAAVLAPLEPAASYRLSLPNRLPGSAAAIAGAPAPVFNGGETAD